MKPDKKNLKLGKRRYGFATGDMAVQYEKFLRKNIYSLDPTYYSVVRQEAVETSDGPMMRVQLTPEVNDPDLEVLVMCAINNQPICLWKEKVWTAAVYQSTGPQNFSESSGHSAGDFALSCSHPMTEGTSGIRRLISNNDVREAVIYQLGEDTDVVT